MWLGAVFSSENEFQAVTNAKRWIELSSGLFLFQIWKGYCDFSLIKRFPNDRAVETLHRGQPFEVLTAGDSAARYEVAVENLEQA